MKRCFNINGACYPDENYMVNLDGRAKEIKKLIDGRKYFVINRARQWKNDDLELAGGLAGKRVCHIFGKL